MPAWLSLLLWKPVAVAAIFFSFRIYIHRSLRGHRRRRRAALILALFFGAVSVPLRQVSVIGDLMPAFLSWGYTFGLVALGLMVVALVLYARAREQGASDLGPRRARRRGGAAAPLAGRAADRHRRAWPSWCSGRSPAGRPGAMSGDGWPGWARPLLTLGISGLGILYYVMLGRADLSWKLAQQASKHELTMWPILLAIAPLAIPALLAWRPAPESTMMAIINRVWVPAAIGISVLSATGAGATPLHAFQGIALPLGVLAVEGVGAHRMRAASVLAARMGYAPGRPRRSPW